MRGRELELDLVLRLLDSTRRGKSGILLLEGQPGMGKSSLLAAAADAANAEGFCLATSVAEEPSSSAVAPLAPQASLADANGHGAGGQFGPGTGARARLEELGSAGPVLVSLDDLHYACPATLQALRSLPGLLAPFPFSWLLARSSEGGSDDCELLFETLEHEGAIRACLQPLGDDAQMALMTDMLGAIPDRGLVKSAACASGNPFTLTEFVQGLVDEKAISIADGGASLISDQVPRRFQAVLRDRLRLLAPKTRHFLATGAILGRSFRLEDVAEMLGESPGSLLAPLEDASAAKIVTAIPEAISFQHDLLWRAVIDEVPQHVREALHRQAGDLVLTQGGSAISAAHHLLASARHGDPVVLARLDQAVADGLRSSPRAAAAVAVQALELTPAAQGERAARTVSAVRALTAAGLWEEASKLAQPALAVPMEARASAPLRCALASLHAMSDRQAEALIEAESIMADPDVAPADRDDAKIVLLQALTGLRDKQRMAQVATAILEQPGAKRCEVIVGALLVLALVAWDTGRVAEALDLAAEATRTEAGGTSPNGRRFQPELFLASRLIDIRRLTDAEAVMVNPADRIDEPGPVSWSAASPDILRARLALARWRLDEAAAAARSALVHSGAAGMRLHSLIARSILAAVALRRGDLHTAARQLESAPSPVCHFVSVYEVGRGDLVQAQVEEAQSGPGAALTRLAGLYDTIHEHQYLLMSDPASAPWLVRVALAAGDRERAEAIAAAVTGIYLRNPGIPVFRASAEHARGVLESDQACLEQAVRSHDDPWARASAEEDLGVLCAAAGGRDDAVRHLGAALDDYLATGAERDMARIRRRLRRLGVRPRHWTSAKRPPTGWDSLTDTDRSVSNLVAQGLTNQQVADQLFISVHTVAFHLRQVFSKLGIRSRVELARLALEKTARGEQGALEA
jgi:DNA-binding CsgD family transcriptional regulator